MNPASDQATLLIIDDQPTNIKVLNEVLKEDYRIIFAVRGDEGLELAREQLPDLVLLDVIMPEMDGHEVCRRLKLDDKTRDIPIIFITSLQVKEFETAGLLLGAVDYVTKPFHAEIVRLRIRNQLELKQHRDHLEKIVAAQTAQLRLAKEAAEAADRAKADLMMLFSHELRTPLNGIIGFLDLLSSTGLDRHQQEYVDTVNRSAQTLADMVEKILDLVGLELNESTPPRQPFNLEILLLEVVQRFAPIAANKGLELNLQVDFATLPPVTGSRNHLGKILGHLLDNAIKFSETGRIRLEVSLTERSGQLRFAVSDTGIGIEKGLQEVIFHSFTQGEKTLTRRHGGLGMGLAYCRKALSRLFDSELRVESEPGRGSVFHFEACLGAS
ncbi:MAG: response regulator [Magnetococcales bacterium]|nr:response regulator [Magnetococcales bacterium]